jgi:hypothetical protein
MIDKYLRQGLAISQEIDHYIVGKKSYFKGCDVGINKKRRLRIMNKTKTISALFIISSFFLF